MDLPLSQLRGVKDSPRGPILIFESGGTVWLARGGPSPMGWRKVHSKKPGRNPNRWKHARPPVDSFLRPAAFYEAKRESIKAGIREARDDAPPAGGGRAAWWVWFERRAGAIQTMVRRWAGLTKMIRWAASFPPGSLEFLERHRFEKRRWHLMSLYVRVPAGRELFDDFPQLAFALANSWVLRKQPVARPLRSLRRLVHRPRSEILRWLDLPAGDGVLRLLRRLDPASLSGTLLARFRRALEDQTRNGWLANLPVPALDPGILGILAFRHPVSFPMLCAIARRESVSDHPGSQTVDSVYSDILRMCHSLGTGPPHELARITSKRRLVALHDDILRLYHRQLLAEREVFDWTDPIDPPLVPANFMEGIWNRSHLIREGREMEHCVASYAGSIAHGSHYVYAVHHPAARLTLSIVRDDHGQWHLDQLIGFRNAPAPDAARRDVLAWLAQAPKPNLDLSEEELPF